MASRLLKKASFLRSPICFSKASLVTVSQSTVVVPGFQTSKPNFLAMTRTFSSTSVATPHPPTSSHEHIPLTNAKSSLIYTETDEAPALATFSLLPILSKVSLWELPNLEIEGEKTNPVLLSTVILTRKIASNI